jgi:hypothetical protein
MAASAGATSPAAAAIRIRLPALPEEALQLGKPYAPAFARNYGESDTVFDDRGILNRIVS